MKSIRYIIPYFGKLPCETFQIWLDSCGNNPTIEWYLFTDDKTDYKYPDNVKVHYCSFDWVKSLIQKKFDFNISLKTPYRLCDFKVSYGHVFEDYLHGVDFWGYCDIDLIWGDIRSYYTDKILEEYDRIGWLGHSSLYKNNELLKLLYRQELNGTYPYKEYFSAAYSNKMSFFDENAINTLCKYNGVKVYKEVVFADISPLNWNFDILHKEKNIHPELIFSYKDGVLSSHYFSNSGGGKI